MRFDFLSFFRERGIDVKESGAGVKKGNFNVKCPFCDHDEKFMMGVNPTTGYFGCWWSREHRGKNPAKLVQRILNCSWSEACTITGSDAEITPGEGSLEELGQKLESLTAARISTGHRIIQFPSEFREVKPTGLTEVAFNYLIERRGYAERDVEKLCKDYRLRYAVTGEMKKRIILPFLYKQQAIVGWQARAIGESRLRYLTYPASIKETLFNYGNASAGGKMLVIVEGPFGALLCDFYGRKHGIRSVAVAGVGFTEKQVSSIYKIASKFEKILVLFDPQAELQAFDLCSRLSRFDVTVGNLPEGVDGPDDLNHADVVDFVMGCC